MRKVIYTVSGIFILLSVAYSAYYHYARSADLINPFDTRWGIAWHCIAIPLMFAALGVILSAAFVRPFKRSVLRHIILWCGGLLLVLYFVSTVVFFCGGPYLSFYDFLWEYGEVSVVFLLLGGMIGSFFAKE